MSVHDTSDGLALGVVVSMKLSFRAAAAGMRRGTGNCVENVDVRGGKDWHSWSSFSEGSEGSEGADWKVVRRWISESSKRWEERRGGVGIVRAGRL
jgi:hypothetical protein